MAKEKEQTLLVGPIRAVPQLNYVRLPNGDVGLILEHNNYTTQIGVKGYQLGVPPSLEVEDLGQDPTYGNGDS